MSSSRLVVKTLIIPASAAFFLTTFLRADPDPHSLAHHRTRPQPPAITPATPRSADVAGKAPSDAVILFDGKDLSQWVALDGAPTKWVARDGFMECVPSSGYVRTLQNFGDCQLHVEWATPTPAR